MSESHSVKDPTLELLERGFAQVEDKVVLLGSGILYGSGVT